jgi:NTE family protein
MRSKWITAYADMRFYSMDDMYFPSHGHEGGWRFEETFGEKDSGSNAHIFSANWRQVLPASSWLSFIPTFDTRLLFLNRNKENERVLPNDFIGNLVGGEMRGRYTDQQIPFCGWHYSIMMRAMVASANVEMRAMIVPNLYASLLGGALLSTNSVSSLMNWVDTDYYLGAAAQLAYKTPIGPVKARLEYSNYTNFGFYLGFGYYF